MAEITWKSPSTELPEIGKDIIVKYLVGGAENYSKAKYSKVYNNNNTGSDFDCLVYFANGVNKLVKSATIKDVDGWADFYEGWEEDITEGSSPDMLLDNEGGTQ